MTSRPDTSPAADPARAGARAGARRWEPRSGLAGLRSARDGRDGAVAVRCGTPGGGWTDTGWGELCDRAAAAAAFARPRAGGPPVVVVVDGTADSVATVLGLMDAGVDVVLLEEKTSHLGDAGSPIELVGADTVVGPPDALAAAAGRYRHRLTYPGFRAQDDQPRAQDDRPRSPSSPPAGRRSAVYQLTSGSTGEPRAARQTVPGVVVGGVSYVDLFEITGSDVVMVTVPLAHSYGLAGMFAALISGATLVTLPRFSIRSTLAGLDDGATVLLGTPMVYQLLTPVLLARGRPAGLRTAVSAGGPMGAEADAAARDALGTRVRQIYGITEAGLVACVPRSAHRWPAGSVGTAAPGVRLRVEPAPDQTGTAPVGGVGAADGAGVGLTGRLLVQTTAMFEGYAGSTAPYLTDDGYYDTGDLVRLDPDGYLTVLGRKKSFVNVGGRKVSPRRVERLLSEHPSVRDVFVFGVDRADGEQEIQAAVVLAHRARLDEVLAHCRAGALMPYEIPHHVHVLERIPRTGMGKVDFPEVLAATRQPATAPN